MVLMYLYIYELFFTAMYGLYLEAQSAARVLSGCN